MLALFQFSSCSVSRETLEEPDDTKIFGIFHLSCAPEKRPTRKARPREKKGELQKKEIL
jgi:hypothetical protein